MKRKQYFVKKFLPAASPPSPPVLLHVNPDKLQRYYLRACIVALVFFALLWYFHFSIVGESVRLREVNNQLIILLQMQSELCEEMSKKRDPAQFAAFLVAMEMRSMKHREWFAANVDDKAVAQFDDFIVALREDVSFLQQTTTGEDELKHAFTKLQSEVELALQGARLKDSVQLLRVARKISDEEKEEEEEDSTSIGEPKSNEKDDDDVLAGGDGGGAEQYGQVD